MAMYESFARVYDRFMDNVPYDKWACRLHRILLDHKIDSGLVLDLGCGTGQMTRRFRSFGYDMIGVDGSEDMLEIALEKEQSSESGEDGAAAQADGEKRYPILYLLQDMRAFELYGTVRAIYSCCDCLNYLMSGDDLEAVFSLVMNYLDPGGIFVFDMNTEHYYRNELGQNTFADVRDECSIIWQNDYDSDTFENEYDLTIFARRSDGLFEMTQETHFEKAFPFERVKTLAEKTGLVFESVYDGYTEESLKADSSRMLMVLRKPAGTMQLQGR